jgi:hypothetical protein
MVNRPSGSPCSYWLVAFSHGFFVFMQSTRSKDTVGNLINGFSFLFNFSENVCTTVLCSSAYKDSTI